jgi:hypothetical protein
MKESKTCLSICLVLIFFISYCKSEIEKPVLVAGETYSDLKLSPEDQATLEKLTGLLVDCIFNENLAPIGQHIHPERGVFIDLKAKMTRADFDDQTKMQSEYFQKFYFSGEELREKTGDSEQLSVKEILAANDTVLLEFYVETGAQQVEVSFKLKETPEHDFRLNNLVFIKVENRWYFLQLI